jgi:hypothetical protein
MTRFNCQNCGKAYQVAEHLAELIRMLRSNNLASAMKAIDLLEEYGTRKCLPSLAQVALNARGLGAVRAKEAAAVINKRLAQKPGP